MYGCDIVLGAMELNRGAMVFDFQGCEPLEIVLNSSVKEAAYSSTVEAFSRTLQNCSKTWSFQRLLVPKPISAT